MVSQNARTLGLVLECNETLVDFQMGNKSSRDKLASTEKELKKK